jgi:hypothetical protein
MKHSHHFFRNSFAFILILIVLQGCNYNYYSGLELEEQGRFEEANIEFHRAFTGSPSNTKYQQAYQRTAVKTTEDLLIRYDQYVKEKKYLMAYRRLGKANTLTPEHPRVKAELKKWYRILLAGKLDLAQIRSMSNQIPLTDQIILEIRFNTPNATRRLEAPVNYESKIFSVEDVLYDPPQNLLMLYSINSIGVKLVNKTTRRSQFKKFIDFKTPVLVDVQGKLEGGSNGLSAVAEFYPPELIKGYENNSFWYPSVGVRYSLSLDSDVIRVNSSNNHIDYLPKILYINREDKRYFLDFGHLELAQKKTGGLWTFRRVVSEGREYLKQLEKNLILNPFFYYREGGYPFLKKDTGS